MLESITEEIVNIKDLSFVTPEKKVEFHPSEITEEYIEAIKKYLDQRSSPIGTTSSFNIGAADYFAAAANLMILGLGYLVQPTNPQSNQAFRNLYRSTLKPTEEESNAFLDIATDLKLALPNSSNQLLLDENTWQWAVGYLKINCEFLDDKMDVLLRILEPAANLNILYPGKMEEADKELIWGKLNFSIDLGHLLSSQSTLKYFASAKILSPQRFKDVKIDRDFWKMGQACLNMSRYDRGVFCTVAARLAIIASQEIKITDQGIELSFLDNFKEEQFQMPVRRAL